MQQSRSRPGPVSCQSCRLKKLRCSRLQPCSNCSARGIPCHFLNSPPRSSRVQSSGSPVRDDEGLIQRVQRLEAMIEQMPVATTHLPDLAPQGSFADRQALETLSSPAAAIEALEIERQEEVRSLENVGTRDDSIVRSRYRSTDELSDLSNDLRFEVKAVSELLQTLNSVAERSHTGLVYLPIYREAIILLHSYESNVDHVCRILHMPTLKSWMKVFYLRLEQGQPVSTGQTALVLAIFALAAFFYHPLHLKQLPSADKDLYRLARMFSKAALDVLDHSRRTTSGTLEDVQAYILSTMAAFYLDGFSARGRLLSSTAVAIARDLRLHQLDATDVDYSCDRFNNMRMIDLEVKRRVIWYLASTDWLLSTCSGPQEGTYYMHVHHLNVNLPRNVSDDELSMSVTNETEEDSRPTGMTYFLQRLRLAHICRKIADTVPVTFSSLMRTPYEKILTLDQDLLKFLSKLPYFFRLDSESLSQARALETVYPNLVLLRYLLTQTAHSKRVKLHQKFLLRQSTNPGYAYSRTACLASARTVVLSFEKLMETECSQMVARVGMLVHYVHFALVAFVIDLCCNGDTIDNAEIQAELKNILRRLEDLKHISVLLQRSLSSLYAVLQKHNVHFTDLPTSSNNPQEKSPKVQVPPPRSGDAGPTRISNTVGELDDFTSASYNDCDYPWSSMAQANPDTDEWDRLFSEFDTQFI